MAADASDPCIAKSPATRIESSAVNMNAVQYNMILDTSLQELRQSINHWLNPQMTAHTWTWRANYGLSFVNVLQKIDRFITI